MFSQVWSFRMARIGSEDLCVTAEIWQRTTLATVTRDFRADHSAFARTTGALRARIEQVAESMPANAARALAETGSGACVQPEAGENE